jgi:hypothetical protein
MRVAGRRRRREIGGEGEAAATATGRRNQRRRADGAWSVVAGWSGAGLLSGSPGFWDLRGSAEAAGGPRGIDPLSVSPSLSFSSSCPVESWPGVVHASMGVGAILARKAI